jgi:hypothetical protein
MPVRFCRPHAGGSRVVGIGSLLRCERGPGCAPRSRDHPFEAGIASRRSPHALTSREAVSRIAPTVRKRDFRLLSALARARRAGWSRTGRAARRRGQGASAGDPQALRCGRTVGGALGRRGGDRRAAGKRRADRTARRGGVLGRWSLSGKLHRRFINGVEGGRGRHPRLCRSRPTFGPFQVVGCRSATADLASACRRIGCEFLARCEGGLWFTLDGPGTCCDDRRRRSAYAGAFGIASERQSERPSTEHREDCDRGCDRATPTRPIMPRRNRNSTTRRRVLRQQRHARHDAIRQVGWYLRLTRPQQGPVERFIIETAAGWREPVHTRT